MLTLSKAVAPSWIEHDGAGFRIKAMSGLCKHSFVNNPRGRELKFDIENCSDMMTECLLGWRDVVDVDGDPVDFPGAAVAITLLDSPAISAIVGSIMALSFVPDDAKKKP